MTTLEKLDKLYKIRNDLAPIGRLLITGFVDKQNKKLRKRDETFVEETYEIYFPKKIEDIK